MYTHMSRRNVLFTSAAAGVALLPMPGYAAETGWARADTIRTTLRLPQFSSRIFSIVEYGAKGDGITKNTQAIAQAITACHASGGGQVLVPAGRFLTGAIHLKSNVNLHLEQDATLLFSTDTFDYPLVRTRWEGVDLIGYSPLIYAYQQKNIAITGSGTLDGQASDQHWWSWKGPNWRGTVDHGWREGMPHQTAARTKLFQMAEDNVPVEKRIFADGAYLRPAMVQPYGCENVLIEGVKLRRSPFWHLHPVLCTNVIVRHVDIQSHGPNTDGCDPESTRYMIIDDCRFDTGDDCIAVDSGRNAEGRRIGVASEDIVIQNCRMEQGHGALVIGSIISGGVRNIFAENCAMGSPHLSAAIRFKNNAMRGGVLENLYYRNITVSQVGSTAIEGDFNYEEGAKGPYKPILRNVVIDRLTVGQTPSVANLQGLPMAPISNLRISNSSFDGVTHDSIIRYVDGLTVDHVRINGKFAEKL